MNKGICKVCGEEKRVDVCNYCNECYPYSDSCDRYKEHKESGHISPRSLQKEVSYQERQRRWTTVGGVQ